MVSLNGLLKISNSCGKENFLLTIYLKPTDMNLLLLRSKKPRNTNTMINGLEGLMIYWLL